MGPNIPPAWHGAAAMRATKAYAAMSIMQNKRKGDPECQKRLKSLNQLPIPDKCASVPNTEACCINLGSPGREHRRHWKPNMLEATRSA